MSETTRNKNSNIPPSATCLGWLLRGKVKLFPCYFCALRDKWHPIILLGCLVFHVSISVSHCLLSFLPILPLASHHTTSEEGQKKEQPLGCVFALFTKTFIVTETTSLFWHCHNVVFMIFIWENLSFLSFFLSSFFSVGDCFLHKQLV